MVIGYSSTLVYHTFPIPALSLQQIEILAEHSKAILKARARYPDKTMAWLYNPETMPGSLFQVHLENDRYIEGYVYGRVFKDDAQRLEHLFSRYATMKAREDRPLLVAAPRSAGATR
jgi:hypothetical protein